MLTYSYFFVPLHIDSENVSMSEHINPFLKPYGTPHDTVPFDRIQLEDFEEAFMEGIRRDNEYLEKTINNPDKPTFDNTILNPFDENDGYYDLLDRVSTVFFNLLMPSPRRCSPS